MRRADWVKQMWATVDAYRGVPFAWGTHDCCLFSARMRDAIHDTTLTATLLAQYSDDVSGQAFLASFDNLEAAVTSFLGAPQKMALTKRGQVCLISTDAGDGLGVCVGYQIAVASPDVGIAFYPFEAIQKSWPDP